MIFSSSFTLFDLPCHFSSCLLLLHAHHFSYRFCIQFLGTSFSKQWFLEVWKRDVETESSQHYSNVFLEDFGQVILFAREVLDCIRLLRFFKIFGVIFSCICVASFQLKLYNFFSFALSSVYSCKYIESQYTPTICFTHIWKQ